MDNKNTNKVVVLPEDQTKLLKEELEDLIIQANMLLQNKNFGKIKDLMENANTIIAKMQQLENKLDDTQNNLADVLFIVQKKEEEVTKKLQEATKVALLLKEQYNRLKGDIDSIIATNIEQIDSKIQDKLFASINPFVSKAKISLAKRIKEFITEIDRGIERARENFNFFKQNEIDRTLEEIRQERKRGSFIFKLALVMFIVSAALTGFSLYKINKMYNLVNYNAYVLQKNLDNQ